MVDIVFPSVYTMTLGLYHDHAFINQNNLRMYYNKI